MVLSYIKTRATHVEGRASRGKFDEDIHFAQFVLQVHKKTCLTLKMKVKEMKHNIRRSMVNIKIFKRYYTFLR